MHFLQLSPGFSKEDTGLRRVSPLSYTRRGTACSSMAGACVMALVSRGAGDMTRHTLPMLLLLLLLPATGSGIGAENVRVVVTDSAGLARSLRNENVAEVAIRGVLPELLVPSFPIHFAVCVRAIGYQCTYTAGTLVFL